MGLFASNILGAAPADVVGSAEKNMARENIGDAAEGRSMAEAGSKLQITLNAGRLGDYRLPIRKCLITRRTDERANPDDAEK
jgi:hypothetical protein